MQANEPIRVVNSDLLLPLWPIPNLHPSELVLLLSAGRLGEVEHRVTVRQSYHGNHYRRINGRRWSP